MTPDIRRERVLEVAARHADEGYSAVRMRTVAVESGTTVQTLYKEFVNKDVLLLEVLVQWLSEVIEELSVTPPEGDTSAARMEDLLLRALDHMVSREVRMRTCLQAFTNPEPLAATIVGRFEASFGLLLFRAFGDEVDEERRIAVLRVLGGVFYASLVAWMCERRDLDHVRSELLNAVAVTLGD